MIRRKGPLASRVQHSLEQILSLADMLVPIQKPGEAWDMWFVWVIACTAAVTEEQKRRCLSHLEALGTE